MSMHMDGLSYWKALVSNALRKFLGDKNMEVAQVIRNSSLRVENNGHDNWNGGIDYWGLVFELKYKDFIALSDKNSLEGQLLEALNAFHTDESNPIANVLIRPAIEQYIDWNAVLPDNKESTIRLIEDEMKLLEAIATGRSYKDDGVEEEFKERHNRICRIARTAGFEYPITCNTLPEWWQQVKDVGGYTERRVYISQLFAPVLDILKNSDDDSPDVDFTRIATKSEVVHAAVSDAEMLIREGNYSSAIDRVHTALHGYLEQLLAEHNVEYSESDGLPSLYNKLHSNYGIIISPPEVAERVKKILRCANGMIDAINEIRNNNSIAHPNGNLIQEREAKLVIRLVNVVVDYIEDIEEAI